MELNAEGAGWILTGSWVAMAVLAATLSTEQAPDAWKAGLIVAAVPALWLTVIRLRNSYESQDRVAHA